MFVLMDYAVVKLGQRSFYLQWVVVNTKTLNRVTDE